MWTTAVDVCPGFLRRHRQWESDASICLLLALLEIGFSRKPSLQEGAVFGLGFGVFGGDDYGGGYFVVGVEVEELDAGGGAAGGADGFGVDADDLAELADEHHLGGVVDQVDGGDFADLGGGLHGDDALAAAGLEAVGVDVGLGRASCRE